jgi:hypothetical protein
MILFIGRVKLSFLAFGVVFAFCSLSYAANYQCGYEPQGCDQNPDCSAVMQQCNGPYNGQYLCPINQTACNPSHVCPSGGFYNDSVGKCQLNPSISCPSGGSYNPSTDRCEAS